MKLRNIILMTASIAMTACSKQAVPTAIPEDAKIEQQVERLYVAGTVYTSCPYAMPFPSFLFSLSSANLNK